MMVSAAERLTHVPSRPASPHLAPHAALSLRLQAARRVLPVPRGRGRDVTAFRKGGNMSRTIATRGSALVCVAVLATAATAQAQVQQEVWRPQPLQPPAKMFELSVGSGYVQGVGMLLPAQSLADLAGSGFAMNGYLDYRLHPRWSLGLHAEWDELSPRNDQASRALSSTLGTTYHARPMSSGDPWLRLGAGYRVFSDINRETTLVHAFELAKLTIGYDFRTDAQVAFSPVLGADVDLFDWQYAYTVHALSAYPRPQVGAFFFAGLQARIDLCGGACRAGRGSARRGQSSGGSTTKPPPSKHTSPDLQTVPAASPSQLQPAPK
jgi:hypothetical protein